MNKKVTSIVSYFSIVGWVIAYIFGDRHGARFYLSQSFNLAALDTILNILLQIFRGTALYNAAAVLSIILFVFWIAGVWHAIKQDDIPLPLISSIHLIDR